VERPFLRSGFIHPDLRGWAKANRHRLIRAILVLVRSWIARGQPDGEIILGSYEAYSRIVGGILQCAGIDGFLGDLRAELNRCDDQTVEWSAFVVAWHRRFGEREVRSEDLDNEILKLNPEMLAITLGGTASERGRRIKLGQELRKRRDAIVERHRVRVSDGVDRHGCWAYRLEPAAVRPAT
jgi:hypothetical protein